MDKVQRQFDSIKQSLPSQWGWLVWPRVFILPDRWVASLGGAGIFFGFVVIGQSLAQAPLRIQRALLAHEWGHVRCGHAMVPLLNLILLAAYIAASTAGSTLVSLPILGLIAICVVWQVSLTRDFNADTVALKLTSPADLRDALGWSIAKYGLGSRSVRLAERMRRLEGLQK